MGSSIRVVHTLSNPNQRPQVPRSYLVRRDKRLKGVLSLALRIFDQSKFALKN